MITGRSCICSVVLTMALAGCLSDRSAGAGNFGKEVLMEQVCFTSVADRRDFHSLVTMLKACDKSSNSPVSVALALERLNIMTSVTDWYHNEAFGKNIGPQRQQLLEDCFRHVVLKGCRRDIVEGLTWLRRSMDAATPRMVDAVFQVALGVDPEGLFEAEVARALLADFFGYRHSTVELYDVFAGREAVFSVATCKNYWERNKPQVMFYRRTLRNWAKKGYEMGEAEFTPFVPSWSPARDMGFPADGIIRWESEQEGD